MHWLGTQSDVTTVGRLLTIIGLLLMLGNLAAIIRSRPERFGRTGARRAVRHQTLHAALFAVAAVLFAAGSVMSA
jgi:hypothetical protein